MIQVDTKSIIMIRNNASPNAVHSDVETSIASNCNFLAEIDVPFDACDSEDPDGDQLSYYWYAGNINHSSTDCDTSIPLSAGEYEFTLIVTDSYNASTSTAFSVLQKMRMSYQ